MSCVIHRDTSLEEVAVFRTPSSKRLSFTWDPPIARLSSRKYGSLESSISAGNYGFVDTLRYSRYDNRSSGSRLVAPLFARFFFPPKMRFSWELRHPLMQNPAGSARHGKISSKVPITGTSRKSCDGRAPPATKPGQGFLGDYYRERKSQPTGIFNNVNSRMMGLPLCNAIGKLLPYTSHALSRN